MTEAMNPEFRLCSVVRIEDDRSCQASVGLLINARQNSTNHFIDRVLDFI
jgi:hypothetical protein